MDIPCSVREAERLVKQLLTPGRKKTEKNRNTALEAVYLDLAKRCESATGTKVMIIPGTKEGSGKIEIAFYSSDDLERVTDLLINNG